MLRQSLLRKKIRNDQDFTSVTTEPIKNKNPTIGNIGTFTKKLPIAFPVNIGLKFMLNKTIAIENSKKDFFFSSI